MKEGKHAKQKFRVVELYTVLLFVAFIFMSIGYAQISDIDMIISGQAKATAQNGVFIYDVGEASAGGSSGNAAESTVDTYFSTNLGITVVLGDSTDSTISYNVSLYNNSNDKYVFVGVEEPVVYNNANKVKNEYITYSLSGNMKVGETIIGHGADDKTLDFTVTFGYKDGVVPSADADKVLNSLLNIRFRLLPIVSLNAGKDSQVVDSSVYAIYPEVTPYEYQFTVENAASGSYNKVPMKYTLSAELVEGITESPLVVELYDLDGNLLVFDNVEDGIEIAGDGATSPLHNYKVRVKWNEDSKYNSAEYAGKDFKYKVNFVGTPTVETAKYLGYTYNKSFVVNITTAPLNFNVNLTEANVFMESNGKASLELGITNSSNVAYDTAYNVKVSDNTKFIPIMSDATNTDVAISDSGIPRTLNGGTDKNDNFTIDFAADVNDINRKESVNVVLALTSPYTKEITIPVNIRSIVMSAKNEKDGNDAIGNNAQVTNGNVNVTINCDGTYLDSSKNRNLQYAVVEAGGASLSESSWQTIATSEISNVDTTNAQVTKEISVNGNVYARYFDGTKGYGTTQIAIDNIDKESPNAFSVNQDNVSTYSIKVSGSTTDRGSEGTATKYVNINGYQYQIKNSEGTPLTSWTPETETKDTSYTFVSDTSNNLEIKQDTTYIVSMRAIDLAGNMTEVSKEIKTNAVPNSETAIVSDYSPKDWDKGPVTVTFENNSGDNELIIKYQIGNTDGEWLPYPNGGVSVSENTVVYARLFDKIGQSSNNTATATIGNIDNEVPNKPKLTVSNVTATSLKATVTDGYDGQSGIVKYTFKLYSSDWTLVEEKVIETTSDTAYCNFTGLSVYTSYKVNVFASDAVYNWTGADVQVVTTLNDTIAPEKPILIVSDVTTNSLRTTVTNGYDDGSGIVKYTFKIYLSDWTLVEEKVVKTTLDTAYCDFTGLSAYTSYKVNVFASDANNNWTGADAQTIVTKMVENVPELAKGMIPIKYNKFNGKWVICETTDEEWYSYTESDKKWANIMLSDGTYTTSTAVGTEVAEEELGSMFVWIPRYAYKITSGYHSTAGSIDVIFLNNNGYEYVDENGIVKTAKTGYTSGVITSTGYTDYIVHPAFVNGSNNGYNNGEWKTELSGLWVAKFKAGFPTTINDISQQVSIASSITSPTSGASVYYPIFKGRKYAYNYVSVGQSYEIARAIDDNGNPYGLTTAANSHLIKNSEWGAVAYLSISKYGYSGGISTISTEKYKNNLTVVEFSAYSNSPVKGPNNPKWGITAITGYSASSSKAVENVMTYIDTSSFTDVVVGTGGNSYAWNYVDSGKDSGEGTKSSTTGNIYGIYDMGGCLAEYTSSYIYVSDISELTNYGGSFATAVNSTYLATVYPAIKSSTDTYDTYYDFNTSYPGFNNFFGDAMYETSSGCIEEAAWFKQTIEADMETNYEVFFPRGGRWNYTNYVGLCGFNDNNGNASFCYGFRTVLAVE